MIAAGRRPAMLSTMAVLAACGVVLLAGPAFAGSWHAGARGGVNLASLRGEGPDISHPEWLAGGIGGGFVEADLAPSLGIAVEVLYVRKGASYPVDVLGADPEQPIGSFDAHLVLEYLDVPLLMRIVLPGRGPVSSYLVAGPTFGFPLRATFESKGSPDEDLIERLKPLDLGATAGMGVRIATGGARVDVEGRYATGFRDLWNLSDNLDSINQGFSLTLAVSR